jgi:hypothetical protein
LQNAGGIYGLVALSPSVGCYEGGRFARHVPIRVVQPALVADDNHNAGVKVEFGSCNKRKRQATLPSLCMSYEVLVGAWHGTMRVTVCWREVLFNDTVGGTWVQENLLF